MDLVLNQNVTINNAELKKVTESIRKAGANVIGNTYKIAALISHVNETELYLEDGFVDVFDYVKQCFGLEKSSTYSLIKVGESFIEEVKKGNNTTYQTLLTHDAKDFSISQVIKMLPLGIDKARELTADGVITEDMSCRQIEKIVKENTDGTAARGKKKTEEPEEPEEVTPEEDDTELMVEWDDTPELFQSFIMDNYDIDNVKRVVITLP